MKRIGIVGENFQNDSTAFCTFLSPQYEGEIQFIPLLRALKGGYSNAKKVSNLLVSAIKNEALDYIICMRDLDKPHNLPVCEQWFGVINKEIAQRGILFLAVMELEALILADIETFNEIYNVKIQYRKNPIHQDDPKEFLTAKTFNTKRKYDENHAKEIFTKLRFSQVYQKHQGERSFQDFINDFNK
jgi:hypothetical protein